MSLKQDAEIADIQARLKRVEDAPQAIGNLVAEKLAAFEARIKKLEEKRGPGRPKKNA